MSDVVIQLSRIALWAHHGIDESEIRDGGPFELDLTIVYPEPSNATEDSTVGRPDYAAIAAVATETFHARRFALMEPLASFIVERLFDRFSPVSRISVTIRKLRPVMPITLDHVSITITRSRVGAIEY